MFVCNNIYFSRLYILKMLDLHLQTKKQWKISNENLEKPKELLVNITSVKIELIAAF